MIANVKKIGLLWPCQDTDAWDRDPSAPNIIRVGDQLRLYYHGRQNNRIRIGMAEADIGDPLNWRKRFDRPVLDLGPEGSLDSHWAGYPWIVPITDNHFHLYYATWDGTTHDNGVQKKWRTSLAESDDGGLTWQKTNRALIEVGQPGACDEHATGSCAVRQVGNQYWMWYTAISRPRVDWYRISTALATSDDGGHTFTRHSAGAVINLPPRIGSPGSTCSKPYVEVDGDQFRLWFSCAADGQSYRVHYAESRDGIHFNWDPDPFIDVTPGAWDSEHTCYPCILRLNGRVFIFYDGDNYAGIGVAEIGKE